MTRHGAVPFGTDGLTRAKTEHLVALLRAIHRGDLPCPLTHPGYATAGFLGIAPNLAHLSGLDKKGVVAVITAVLAERRDREDLPAPKPE